MTRGRPRRAGPRLDSLEALAEEFKVPWRERTCGYCTEGVGPGGKFCSDQHRSLWYYHVVYREERMEEAREEREERAQFCGHCERFFESVRSGRPVLLRPLPEGRSPGLDRLVCRAPCHR